MSVSCRQDTISPPELVKRLLPTPAFKLNGAGPVSGAWTRRCTEAIIAVGLDGNQTRAIQGAVMAERVATLVIAGQHSFAGLLDNRGLRVLELLNDASTQFLQLSEAVVHRGFINSQIKQQLGEATVPKAAIDFVLLDQSKHESPARRQHAFVEKRSHAAFVTLGNYELQGTLLLKGSPDAVGALAGELSDVFPLTSCRLSIVGGSKDPIPAGVALVNKSKLSVIHIDKQRGPMS